MRKILLFSILSLFIIFSSCSRKPEEIIISNTDTETLTETSEKSDIEEENDTSEILEITEIPGTPPEHTHNMILVQTVEPTCSQGGYKLYKCECGASSKKAIPTKPHTPSNATCRLPSICTVCGAYISPTIPHTTSTGICAACGLDFSKNILVCGIPLDFGDDSAAVMNSFSGYAEILTEGNIKTLIINPSSAMLTVIQFENDALSGIYSFDTSMKFGGKPISSSSGYESDKEGHYKEKYTSDARITLFCDDKKAGEIFAVYLRKKNFEYDYNESAKIYSDFSKHERISFYILNALRAINSVSPLSYSNAASDVARNYAKYMSQSGFFDHDANYPYSARMRDAGIKYSWCGENISHSYENCFYLMCAYYNSESHRYNILLPNYKYIGIGYYKGYLKDGGLEIEDTIIGAQEFYG